MIRSGQRRINAPAWSAWLIGVAVVPLVSRNPLYLATILLVVLFVHLAVSIDTPGQSPWRLFAYVGSIAASLSIAFNVLTVHVGDRAFASLPGWLPIIGGKLTLNALIYGVGSALAISTLLFAAATFHTAVRHADLIRMLPSSFGRLGIAGSIALSFVPQAINAGHDVYDAQRSRGLRLRGVRDAPAFLIPLLSTGLERALTMSEALETRGFGTSARRSPVASTSRTFELTGVVLLIGAGLVSLSLGKLVIATSCVIAAVGLLMLLTPANQRRTRYQPIVWNWQSVLTVTSALPPVVLAALYLINGDILRYEPFPTLDVPPFQLLAGLALASPILPTLITGIDDD